jgi:hypothetical protein
VRAEKPQWNKLLSCSQSQKTDVRALAHLGPRISRGTAAFNAFCVCAPLFIKRTGSTPLGNPSQTTEWPRAEKPLQVPAGAQRAQGASMRIILAANQENKKAMSEWPSSYWLEQERDRDAHAHRSEPIKFIRTASGAQNLAEHPATPLHTEQQTPQIPLWMHARTTSCT